MINDPFLCKKVSEKLIDDHGIYAQPIFYPTVPKGLERLRITVTPKHRKDHIESMIKSLDKVWSDLSLPRKNSKKRISADIGTLDILLKAKPINFFFAEYNEGPSRYIKSGEIFGKFLFTLIIS